RFTESIDAAARKRLVGRSGFEGTYWHSPTLGPILLQSDPVATPNKIRFLEPSSWEWIYGNEGSESTVEWIKNDAGSIWHTPFGTNGRLYNKKVGGAFVRVALMCDQPKANIQIAGVKSSTQAA
ncbi:MAG TPA: hypothetical protein VM487_00575, partial [Phycisphaerae bacterium]|nr:hypothetical protein [Phycisphaerae bacterium]